MNHSIYLISFCDKKQSNECYQILQFNSERSYVRGLVRERVHGCVRGCARASRNYRMMDFMYRVLQTAIICEAKI